MFDRRQTFLEQYVVSKKRLKIEEYESGTPFYLTSQSELRQVCCGCGEVHDWRFRVCEDTDGSVALRVVITRNGKSTANVRRGMKKAKRG